MFEILRNVFAWLTKRPWLALGVILAVPFAAPLWLASAGALVAHVKEKFPDQRPDLESTMAALDLAFERYSVSGANWDVDPGNGTTEEPGEPEDGPPLLGTGEEGFPEDGDVRFSESIVVTSPGRSSSAFGVTEVVVDLGVDIIGNSKSGVDGIKVASWGSPSLVAEGQRIRITYKVPSNGSGDDPEGDDPDRDCTRRGCDFCARHRGDGWD